MANRFSYFSILLLAMSVFPACEKVINVDLLPSKEAIVIEATVTNSKLPFTVLISKTSPYFGTNAGNPVSGARVSIRTERGKTMYFTEKAPGKYLLGNVLAFPGFWYIIDVQCDGVTYTARSFMNEPVQIAELGFSYFNGFGLFDSGYKVSTFIRDPSNIENFYRLKYYVNGKALGNRGEITLYSDKLFDGKPVGLAQRTIVFQKTDTLTVELQSIDEAAYNYFSTLESISGNQMQQSASPSNPISNFNNGALGYFSAYTFDSKTVIVKDLLAKQ